MRPHTDIDDPTRPDQRGLARASYSLLLVLGLLGWRNQGPNHSDGQTSTPALRE